MKALVRDGEVCDVVENEFPVHPDFYWVDCDNTVTAGFLYENGVFFQPAPPPLSNQEIIQQYKKAIEDLLLNKAQEKNYSSATSIATYFNSTNVQWAAEAQAYVAWRDQVYEYAIDILTQCEQGTIPIPSLEQLIDNVPVMIWPE